MALRKLLFASAASAAFALVAATQVPVTSASGCPPPRHFSGACIDVIVYATSPDSNLCCQYPNPCSAPSGWTISYTGCPVAS